MEPLRAQDPPYLGPYRLLGRLGAGGTGEMFLGESPGQRKVTVNLVETKYARDPAFRQRFAREVTAAKTVSSPRTVQVVDADPDSNPPWLVTAYIPGPSLSAAVTRNGPFDPRAVCRLGAMLAEGLAAIHAGGLVHRDLNPANIILGADGPRITGFGLTHPQGAASLSLPGGVTGSPGFMSPEQIARGRTDARGDVFSLGSVLAYAATGRGPFVADTFPLIAAHVVGGRPSLDGITGPLFEAIEACLNKGPEARPALEAVAGYLASAARVPVQRPLAAPRFEPAPEPEPQPSWVVPLQPPPGRPRPGRRVTGAFSAVTDALAALRPDTRK